MIVFGSSFIAAIPPLQGGARPPPDLYSFQVKTFGCRG